MTIRDDYRAAASAYDLYAASSRAGQLAALDRWMPQLDSSHGPVLDIGAGSGANLAYVLDSRSDVSMWAIEPSGAMRALALAKIAERPEWFDRVTLWPDDFFSSPLPHRIGGALLLGAIGHFDPGERAAVFAELAMRLPSGGATLLDLQDPPDRARTEPYDVTVATIGEITYRSIAECWALEGERSRWKISYLTLADDRVLTEDTVEHDLHYPTPDTVAADAARVGLRAQRLDDSAYLLLIRE